MPVAKEPHRCWVLITQVFGLLAVDRRIYGLSRDCKTVPLVRRLRVLGASRCWGTLRVLSVKGSVSPRVRAGPQVQVVQRVGGCWKTPD